MQVFFSEIYDAFNKGLFQRRLASVDFEPNLTRKAIVEFVVPNKLEVGVGVITASNRAVLDETLHGMIHVWNHNRGISDHTSNQYHNTAFKESALEVGMFVGLHKTRGYALTFSHKKDAEKCSRWIAPTEQAGQALSSLMLTLLNNHREDLSSVRAHIADLRANRQPKVYLLKYVCKCVPPNNSIRSGRRPDGDHPLDITCNVCGAKFGLKSKLT